MITHAEMAETYLKNTEADWREEDPLYNNPGLSQMADLAAAQVHATLALVEAVNDLRVSVEGK